MLISPSPSRSAWLIMSWSSSSSMFSPSSSATRARLRKEILLVLSSSKSLNNFSMSSRVLLAHLASHHLEELDELDGAVTVVVDVGDHLLELLVLDLEAEGAHGGLKLADIDHAGGIGVEEGERLADLIELLVGELSWLLTGGGTARHDALSSSPC